MTGTDGNHVLQFDHFELDLTRGQLFRKGESVALRPQSFQMLVHLVQHAGELVSKDELLEAVWGDRIVTDDSITQCVADIRAALGDSERSMLKTVPRRGLIFQLPVMERRADEAGGSKPPRRSLALVGALVLVVLLGAWWLWDGRVNPESPPEAGAADDPEMPRTLVVLPFVDMTAAGDQEHMADGLSDELIMELSQVEGLRVIGRTSSFQFKNTTEDLRVIGDRLGVQHALEGSVRRSNDQWRITAQLVDVRDGFSLWSESYEQPVQDFFAIQDDIADAVTSALRIKLGLGDTDSPWATSSIEAYEQVRLAELKLWESEEENLEAMDHLFRAVDLDPDYAYAWGYMASAYTILQDRVSPDWRTESRAMIERAQQLRPDSAWQRYNSVVVLMRLGQFEEAGRLLREGEDAEALYFTHARLDVSIKAGRAEEAARLARASVRRDPLDPYLLMYLAQALATAGQTGEALEQWRLAIDGEFDQDSLSSQALMTALSHGDEAETHHWLSESARLEPSIDTFAAMFDLRDDPEAARAWLRMASAGETPELGPEENWAITNFAAYYGDTDLALDLIEQTSDTWSIWLPHFAEVRATPRFAHWVSEHGLMDFWREGGWGEFCRLPEDGLLICR